MVGWAASANNDLALALQALDMAVTLRGPTTGLIHHSDRGSVYASGEYREALGAGELHHLIPYRRTPTPGG